MAKGKRFFLQSQQRENRSKGKKREDSLSREIRESMLGEDFREKKTQKKTTRKREKPATFPTFARSPGNKEREGNLFVQRKSHAAWKNNNKMQLRHSKRGFRRYVPSTAATLVGASGRCCCCPTPTPLAFERSSSVFMSNKDTFVVIKTQKKT